MILCNIALLLSQMSIERVTASRLGTCTHNFPVLAAFREGFQYCRISTGNRILLCLELSQLKIELYIYIPKLKLSVQSLHCCVTFLHMCLHHVNKVHLSFMLTTKELHIAAYSDRHEKVQVKDRRGV